MVRGWCQEFMGRQVGIRRVEAIRGTGRQTNGLSYALLYVRGEPRPFNSNGHAQQRRPSQTETSAPSSGLLRVTPQGARHL